MHQPNHTNHQYHPNSPLPQTGMTNINVLREIQSGYRMPCPKGCPQPLYSIMLQCWAAHEGDRPTFSCLQRRLEEMLNGPGAEYCCASTMLVRQLLGWSWIGVVVDYGVWGGWVCFRVAVEEKQVVVMYGWWR